MQWYITSTAAPLLPPGPRTCPSLKLRQLKRERPATAGTDSIFGVIGGGFSNTIHASSNHDFIGGGYQNEITDCESAIAGGARNRILAHNSFIGGGTNNCVDVNSFVGTIPGETQIIYMLAHQIAL